MTSQNKSARYNTEEINSRHQVAFINKPNTTIKNWYWDFETDSWIKCTPINRLPYDLCSFKLDNDPDDVCIVTSLDSYRLIHNLDDAPSIEQMYKEKEWREQLLTPGKELDFQQKPNTDNYVKAKVYTTYSDIIPGVLMITSRKQPYEFYGYYYLESKQLFKACTFTDKITKEELIQEYNEAQYFKLKCQNRQNQIEEIKSQLPFVCAHKYLAANKKGEVHFVCYTAVFDTRSYYKNLNMFPVEFGKLTREVVMDHYIGLLDEEEKYDLANELDQIYNSDGTKQTGKLIKFLANKGYQILWDMEEGLITKEPAKQFWATKKENELPNKKYFELESGYDAYWDIRVYGATWAKFVLMEDQGELREIPMDLVDGSDGSEPYFTFNDITQSNPFFNTGAMSAKIRIETDGTSYSTKKMIIDKDSLKIVSRLGNYAVTWFDSKNLTLFLGHLWQPSFIEYTNNLIQIEYLGPNSNKTKLKEPGIEIFAW